MFSIHKFILRKKRFEMEKIEKELSNGLASEIDSTQMERNQYLLNIYEKISVASEWPFKLNNFILILLTTIGSYILSQIL
jgi:hypothetical protein